MRGGVRLAKPRRGVARRGEERQGASWRPNRRRRRRRGETEARRRVQRGRRDESRRVGARGRGGAGRDTSVGAAVSAAVPSMSLESSRPARQAPPCVGHSPCSGATALPVRPGARTRSECRPMFPKSGRTWSNAPKLGRCRPGSGRNSVEVALSLVEFGREKTAGIGPKTAGIGPKTARKSVEVGRSRAEVGRNLEQTRPNSANIGPEPARNPPGVGQVQPILGASSPMCDRMRPTLG